MRNSRQVISQHRTGVLGGLEQRSRIGRAPLATVDQELKLLTKIFFERAEPGSSASLDREKLPQEQIFWDMFGMFLNVF